LGQNSKVLFVQLEALIIKALKDPDGGIRKLVLQHFLKHLSDDRLEAVMQTMSHLGFSGRDLPERVLMLQVVGRFDHEQKVLDFLCDLLLKYRLFSSDGELKFQSEVAKQLVRSDNPKAAKAISKVMKRWTVPSQVKTIIQDEIDAVKAEENASGADA